MLIMVSTKFRTSPNESITSIWAIWPELRKSLFNNLKSSKTKMCNNIIGFQFPLGSGALKELLLNTLYHFVKIIKLHIVFHWLPSVYSENKNFQFYKHPLDISKKKYQLARWMMLLCLRVSCVCRISERVEITDTAEVILTWRRRNYPHHYKRSPGIPSALSVHQQRLFSFCASFYALNLS